MVSVIRVLVQLESFTHAEVEGESVPSKVLTFCSSIMTTSTNERREEEGFKYHIMGFGRVFSMTVEGNDY